MLLYLATAPLLPPCLKIAVNYKCSLNVSSDPEMQVGRARRRDGASPSLKRPRHDFSPSLSRFLQSSLSPRVPLPAHPHPLPNLHPHSQFFVFSMHPPAPHPPNPLRLCFSVPLVFPYIPSSPSPPLTLSSVAFHRLCGSEPGEGIGGFGSFSPTRGRTAARHWRPRL